MLKATGYSSLFSLGLLAPHTHYPHTGSPLQSPLPTPSTTPPFTSSPLEKPLAIVPPKIRINTQLSSASSSSSTAPFSAILSSVSQPAFYTHTLGSNSKAARRRRSSLSATASPKGGIKSPTRAAGVSFKSAVLMSPRKTRVELLGVDEETDADSTPRSILHRLRSVSIGGGFRTRRRVIPMLLTAPPTIPLPPPPSQLPSTPIRSSHMSLPSISSTKHSSLVPSPRIASPHTRPTTRRILVDTSVNSRESPSSATIPSSIAFNSPVLSYLAPDFTARLMMAMATPPASEASSPIDGQVVF